MDGVEQADQYLRKALAAALDSWLDEQSSWRLCMSIARSLELSAELLGDRREAAGWVATRQCYARVAELSLDQWRAVRMVFGVVRTSAPAATAGRDPARSEALPNDGYPEGSA
jgi:hypothetical protein